jgi:hypothetical protein
LKTTLCIKITGINVRIEPSTAAGGSTDATYGIAVDVDIDTSFLNRIHVIRVFAVRVTPIIANKNHAINA